MFANPKPATCPLLSILTVYCDSRSPMSVAWAVNFCSIVTSPTLSIRSSIASVLSTNPVPSAFTVASSVLNAPANARVSTSNFAELLCGVKPELSSSAL